MQLPLTVSCHQLPPQKQLQHGFSLLSLRICLFFFTTSWRYAGCALALSLLLMVVGATGQPLTISQSAPLALLVWGSRILSILIGLLWITLVLCRWVIQLTRGATWQQEMMHNENSLRYRISILEDWLVLPRVK